MALIVQKPALISKLLNRELAPAILDLAEQAGLRVFPREWSDFKMHCSCPDWAVPCKHLAAVIYMLSREIDIALLLKFKEENRIGGKRKALVIVPTGLLINWESELARFAPTHTSHRYHGPSRSLEQVEANIILTSYGVVRSDIELLRKRKWYVVVIDGAQNIKNYDTAQLSTSERPRAVGPPDPEGHKEDSRAQRCRLRGQEKAPVVRR